MSDIFDDLMQGHDPMRKEVVGAVTYYPNLAQRTEEWMQLRLGLLTASEMSLVLTPTLKVAANDKVRSHIYEIAAQRLTDHSEPSFEGYDMQRGLIEEVEARKLYAKHIAPVRECGFVINEGFGFRLGYSPDGLVGDDGLIEIKSRIQKYQVQTIKEHVADAECRSIPSEYVMQVQGALLITGREWCDFISYSNGMPMVIIRVHPNPEIHEKMIEAVTAFETSVAEVMAAYRSARERYAGRLIPTERKDYQEMMI